MTQLSPERLSLPAPRLPTTTARTRSRAVGGAFAIHVVVAGLLVSVPATSRVQSVPPQPTRTTIRMVYLVQPGPGGGGGGGGRREYHPPPRATASGQDAITLQPTPRPTIESTVARTEEPPPVAVSVPLQALASGTRPLIGLPDALPSAVLSNGSGDGEGIGTGSGTGSGEGAGSGLGPGIGGGTGGGVYRPGGGATQPVLLHEVRPAYTADALRRKLSGVVMLEAIVRADGRADQIRVLRSLDHDLDGQAVAAIRQWLFAPGRVANRPVDVYVTIELSFTIR